jgi:hypothetical protein
LIKHLEHILIDGLLNILCQGFFHTMENVSGEDLIGFGEVGSLTNGK